MSAAILGAGCAAVFVLGVVLGVLRRRRRRELAAWREWFGGVKRGCIAF